MVSLGQQQWNSGSAYIIQADLPTPTRNRRMLSTHSLTQSGGLISKRAFDLNAFRPTCTEIPCFHHSTLYPPCKTPSSLQQHHESLIQHKINSAQFNTPRTRSRERLEFPTTECSNTPTPRPTHTSFPSHPTSFSTPQNPTSSFRTSSS